MTTTDEQTAYDAVYRYVYEQMGNGIGDDRIRHALEIQGWDAARAAAVVSGARGQFAAAAAAPPLELASPGPAAPLGYASPATHAGPAPAARGQSGDMVVGALICLVGLAITFGSYAFADSGSGGGPYVVAWGAIAFGALRFFKGLLNLGRAA